MATCDHPSDLFHSVAYPTVKRPGLRIDLRSAALLAKSEKHHPVRSNLEGKEVGDIFYLVESRPRNLWAAAGSLALQSLLLFAVIVIPLYHTEILPKRQTLTMLYAPPPPPPAASNATRLRMPTPMSTYSSTSISIPSPVHKTQEPPPTSDGTIGGVLGGVPGGVVGGVPGGVLSEVLGSTRSAPTVAKTPDPTPVKRIRVAARVVEANLIHDVTPTYPPEAGRERIEGTVVLLAVIGKDGSVQDVRVESGLPILAQAAIDAVKQWRYKPYLFNGEPVEVDSRITINFTLSRG
jgi:periplasmic protein TonB